MNIVILKELLKQDCCGFTEIHELMNIVITPNTPTLISMLSLTSVESFKSICFDLKTVDIGVCNDYANILVANADKFWKGDADTVYSGINSLLELLSIRKQCKEIGIIFNILMSVVVAGTNVELTNLFYCPSFYSRLGNFKQYNGGFFRHLPFHAYVDQRLVFNKDKYEALKKSLAVGDVKSEGTSDSSLYQFIERIIENNKWHDVLTHSVSDEQFKATLLKYINDYAVKEEKTNLLSRIYSILFIFFDINDVHSVYRKSGDEELSNLYTPSNVYVGALLQIVGLIRDWIGMVKVHSEKIGALRPKKHLLKTAVHKIEYILTLSGPSLGGAVVRTLWEFCNHHVNSK